VKKRLEEH